MKINYGIKIPYIKYFLSIINITHLIEQLFLIY